MSIQINVGDAVNATDVFLSHIKKWVKEVKVLLLRAVDLVFNTNNYSNWKALPVRGPDTKVSIYTSISGNF